MSKVNKYAQPGKRVSTVRRNGQRAYGTVSHSVEGKRGAFFVIALRGGGTLKVRASQLESPKA